MKDTKEEKILIKIGDVFFANADAINTWSNTAGIVSGVNELMDDVPYNFRDILIAVKYLGDGIVEEMITGEKMMVLGESYSNIEYEDWKINGGKSVNYYGFDLDFKYFSSHSNSDNPKKDYINRVNDFKKISLEYPLTLIDDNHCSLITDELKKKYLEHTDNEREIAILKIKEKALEVLPKVHKYVDKCLTGLVDTEIESIIDIAYLENELFEFKNKKISR